MKKSEFTRGLIDGIPICLGYLSVSFAFGIFAVQNGLSFIEAILVSMTNVTSAGQLAGVPIIATGGSFIGLAASQFIINLRYSLMSVILSQKLDKNVTLIDRLVLSFVNTDEVFAVAAGQHGDVKKSYMYGLIITPYLGWSVGTAIGAVCGNILPVIVTSALGVAIYGMFIAIVTPEMKKNKAVAICVLLAVALSCLFAFVPVLKSVETGFVVIICSVAASALLAVLAPIEMHGEEPNIDG